MAVRLINYYRLQLTFREASEKHMVIFLSTTPLMLDFLTLKLYLVNLLQPIIKSVDWTDISWSALVLYRSVIKMRPVAPVASNSVHEGVG